MVTARYFWRQRATIAVADDPDEPETMRVIVANEPCHLSFARPAAVGAAYGDGAAEVTQSVTLFLRPALRVPPGSQITVDGVIYAQSGMASIYSGHQEIALELQRRMA